MERLYFILLFHEQLSETSSIQFIGFYIKFQQPDFVSVFAILVLQGCVVVFQFYDLQSEVGYFVCVERALV